MQLSITIDGQEHTLEIVRNAGLSCRMDGVPFSADVVEVEPGLYSLLIGGKSFTVRVGPGLGDTTSSAAGNGHEYAVTVGGIPHSVSLRDSRRLARAGRAKLAVEGIQNVMARMPGKVVRVLVSEGDAVKTGDGLVVVEAMKMQNEIKCPKSGKVKKVLVSEGKAVNAGEILLTVE